MTQPLAAAPCRVCETVVDATAAKCPKCGEPNPVTAAELSAYGDKERRRRQIKIRAAAGGIVLVIAVVAVAVLLRSTAGDGRKASGVGKKERPRAKPEVILPLIRGSDEVEVRTALQQLGPAASYSYGDIRVQLDHEWFNLVSISVDRSTGSIHPGHQVSFYLGNNGVPNDCIDAIADVLEKADPVFKPVRKDITDKLAGKYKYWMGAGPEGPLVRLDNDSLAICTLAEGSKCVALVEATVKAAFPKCNGSGCLKSTE